MRFYLGAPEACWLERSSVPLFVSHRRLSRRRQLPRAVVPWALDSGGFSELSMFGEWRTTPREYVAAVRRYRDEVGGLEWAAVQDWMCEPWMVKKTGLSVAEHQRRTVASFLDLWNMAPDVPWAPVVQGWQPDDYVRCVDLYGAAGVNLAGWPVVGLGSVCRRQAMPEAARIAGRLSSWGLRLHGFGFKSTGLDLCANALASADSMAWSAYARRRPVLCGHRDEKHRNCANCHRFAFSWAGKMQARADARVRAAAGGLFGRGGENT